MGHEEFTDRELLIRIDERQQHMYTEMQKTVALTDRLIDRCHCLEKNSVSKGSVSWFISVLGGLMGFCLSIYLIFTNKTQP